MVRQGRLNDYELEQYIKNKKQFLNDRRQSLVTKAEQQRTRMRIPLKRRRKQNEKQRNEVKENKDESFLTPFQTSFTQSPSIPQFSQPPPSFPPYNHPSSLKVVGKEGISNSAENNEDFFFRGDIDPFEEMKSDFDVNNDDWISTISEAFEGFSDFKK